MWKQINHLSGVVCVK